MDEARGLVMLRPLRPADAEVLASWATDADFCREAGWTVDQPVGESLRFHRAAIRSPAVGLIRLGVTHRGVLVGFVDLHGEDPHRRELGFLIGRRSSWGQGLGFLAGAAGLAYGFGHLGLQQVWAEALDANLRSIRILHRLGLIETGRGNDAVFLDQPTHYRQFVIGAEDWSNRTR